MSIYRIRLRGSIAKGESVLNFEQFCKWKSSSLKFALIIPNGISMVVPSFIWIHFRLPVPIQVLAKYVSKLTDSPLID